MKRTLVPLASTFLAGSAFADYPAVVLADAPVAYFRFEEEAGAAFAADSSGNGNDAADYAVIGSGEIGVPAALGKGVRFNGDGAIITGLTLDPAAGDFSIELIMRRDSTDNAVEVVVSNQDGAGLGRSNLTTIPVADTGTAALGSFVGGATTNSGIAVAAAEWRHLILTYDSANSTIRTFVDGVEGVQGFLTAESATGAWVIGSHKSTNSQWTNGVVDEVAIYDKRLDDPNGDDDAADSVVATHFNTYLNDTAIFKFEATPSAIVDGESATLSWEVSPDLTALSIDNGVGDVLPFTEGNPGERFLGDVSVSPTETTTYTLTGSSAFETDTVSIEIIVDPVPTIAAFTASQPEVPTGGTVRLSWTVEDATSVEIDNGVGAVDPATGSVDVPVSEETTFTLTATNANGMGTAEVTVTVYPSADPNLVAHWRVGEQPGETTGTTLLPEGGSIFDGPFIGTPTFDSADPAPVPDGSTASISFPGDGASWVDVLDWGGIGGSAARTVAFWFKGPNPQLQNNATMVSWGTNATTNRFDTRQSGGANGNIRTEVSGSGSEGSAIIADDTWHHIAVVMADDGTPNIGEVQFYVDGEPDGLTVVGATDINTATTLNVRIGASRAIGNRTLTGKLDDIRIYNKALDADEVKALVEGSAGELQITSIVRNPDGSVTLEWNGRPGQGYSVDYSFDLEGDDPPVFHWLELTDGVEGGEYTDTDFAPGSDTIFYRVRESE